VARRCSPGSGGDVFLAMDATLRASWLGHTDDAYHEICELAEA
jgi:hypothetical protein